MITTRIRGDERAIKKLNKLGSKTIRKVNAKAVREGLKPAASAAKKNAPKDTGTLRKSIGRKTKSYKSGNAIGIVGRRVDRTAPHYWLVELGHRVAKGGSLRRERGRRAGKLGNTKTEGRSVGFVKGRRFMERALTKNRQKMLGFYSKWLASGIRTEAKKP